MKFKERLEKMVTSGTITIDQAKELESGIASVTTPIEVKLRTPISKIPFIIAAAVCAEVAGNIIFTSFWGSGESIQHVQNVAETMNQPNHIGEIGKIGPGMSALMITTILGLPIIGTWMLFLPGIYNRFVSLQAEVDTAWAHVESCYQKRTDLLSNLITIVRDYMKQEEKIHDDVSKTRAASATLEDVEKAVTENSDAPFPHVNAAKLFAVVEEYPDLQASENVKQLQSQLDATEEQINIARMYFNDATRDYNKSIGKVPGSIMASIAGFKPRAYFEAQAGASKTVNA